jgi:hypothetical protein
MASCPTCRGEKRDVIRVYMATSPTQSQATANDTLLSVSVDCLMSPLHQKNVSESNHNMPLPPVPVPAPLPSDDSGDSAGSSGSAGSGSEDSDARKPPVPVPAPLPSDDSGDSGSSGSAGSGSEDSDSSGSAGSGSEDSDACKPPVPPKTAAEGELLAAKPVVLTTTLRFRNNIGCTALTLNGDTCSRKNNGFSEYCWQHDPEPRCQAMTNKHKGCSRKLASDSKSHFCEQHRKQSTYRRSLNRSAL